MSLKIDMDEEGVRYESTEDVPHGLPIHEHATRDECHTVEVLEGEVVVFFDARAIHLAAGHVFRDMDVAQRHGVWPRGKAVWYHRRFGPAPRWYETLTEGDKHTTVDQRVDLPNWAHHYLEIPRV